MRVIKRNGSEVEFDRAKITNAVTKASMSVEDEHRMDSADILDIALSVEEQCEGFERACSVEEIQDAVEDVENQLTIGGITLDDRTKSVTVEGEQVQNLLSMTPHVYRISKEGADRLRQTEKLTDTASCVLNLYRPE